MSSLPRQTRRPFRAAFIAIVVTGIVAVFASAASAHSSGVTHQETCTDDGATMTVVTFDNDYNLPATVSYHWGSDADSTATMAANSGTTKPTVSLPSHAVGTLTYHVTWSDNVRQPAQGDATLTIAPLTGCHETATTQPSTTSTTASATTTTTKATTTTTARAATTPTTQAATTPTTQAATTTSTTVLAGVAAVTTTGPGTLVLGETLTQPEAAPLAALPRTGSATGMTVTVAAIVLALGAMALRLGRSKAPTGS